MSILWLDCLKSQIMLNYLLHKFTFLIESKPVIQEAGRPTIQVILLYNMSILCFKIMHQNLAEVGSSHGK